MRGLTKTIRQALDFIRDQRGKIILAQALMLLGTGLGLLPPLLLGAIFDSRGPLTHTLGLLALTGVTAASVGYGKNVLLGSISHRVALRLRTRVYLKLQRLPQAYFVEHHGGEIVSTLLNDIKLFTEALSTGVVYVVEMLVSLVAVVTLLLRLDVVLSLTLMGMLLPTLVIAKRVGRPVSGRSAEAQASLSEITDVLAQSLAGMDVIKSYALQRHSAALFGRANDRWFGHALGLTRLKARAGLMVNILSALAVVVIVGLGAHRVDLGFLTLGALTSFILYAQGLVGPLSSASNLYMDVRAALAAMDRVCILLDAPEEAG
ncbi:MAG TPA: ABC transporter ATP-binding protein, partial [Clostridia bacterium]|nr:ABC transporter ATP-binding protein [Clostridia bacterium]